MGDIPTANGRRDGRAVTVTLHDELAAAVAAVARIAGVDPEQIVAGAVADWLATRREPLTVAVAAVDALFPAGELLADDRATARYLLESAGVPEEPLPDPLAAPGGHQCPEDGCDRTFVTPHGVRVHRSRAHRRRREVPSGQSASRTAETPPGTDPVRFGTCEVCVKPTSPGRRWCVTHNQPD